MKLFKVFFQNKNKYLSPKLQKMPRRQRNDEESQLMSFSLSIEWNDGAATVFLKYIDQQRPKWLPERPAWFPGNDLEDLKTNALKLIRTIGGGQSLRSTHTSCVAPMTLSQYSQVKDNIRDMMTCPQVVAAYRRWDAAVLAKEQNTPVGPIGKVLVISSDMKPLCPTMDNVAPPAAHGVQLFQ